MMKPNSGAEPSNRPNNHYTVGGRGESDLGAHASARDRSSSFQLAFQLASDRPARGSLGGPVLQSSKPKESHVRNGIESNQIVVWLVLLLGRESEPNASIAVWLNLAVRLTHWPSVSLARSGRRAGGVGDVGEVSVEIGEFGADR
ncbi:hypothetical protein DY000_02017032 [Brassica cretica]|uniref:DUF4005 domain-containing protein n=1 Tax=Brassica cretica TaxID=69181 RepID=A0ABQ7D2I2_BRACR|nr:hypothetical protein DY000_02017032 [Brassica cretica]